MSDPPPPGSASEAAAAPPPEASPPPASEPHRPVSTTPTLVRVGVATVFLLVWLAAEIVDFFFITDGEALPIWFHGAGLMVLGYLLGVPLETFVGGVLRR